MTTWGYTLSSEEAGPLELVDRARAAEDAGFDFVTISDHFHPWTTSQGHSPFVWSTIGGIATTTSRVSLGTGVTCPIVRIHPAIVAQAAATAAAMMPHRFFLGVGTGEALNEHVTGQRWPAIEIRREMLVEALEIMRRLWAGETVDHWGEHFTVENARLFTLPPEPVPVIVAASGPATASLAARHGDGLWSTSPDAAVVDAYREGGGAGPCYGQVTVCFGPDEAQARATAREIWPNAAVPGQLSQDLPTWTHFEQAASLVTEEAVADQIPCGPDPGPVVAAVRSYMDAGFDHIHIHQVGPDQRGFLRWWTDHVQPRLGDRAGPSRRAS